MELIKTLSHNFTRSYNSTSARTHPDFKGCSSDYMVAVKNCCNYKFQKKVRPNPTKIPKPVHDPNPVLTGMFDHNDGKIVAYFVGLIQETANSNIITEVELDYINGHVRKIFDYSDPVRANLILLKLHANVRVRAVACAVELF
jgi:hypothetical protein